MTAITERELTQWLRVGRVHPSTDTQPPETTMLAKMTEAEILQLVEERQEVCRRHPTSHPLWQKSNRILSELYAEMAKRDAA